MRKRVNWVDIVNRLNNSKVNELFFCKLAVLHRGRYLSSNRCAYYALKDYYSTTTIDELLEKVNGVLNSYELY